MHHTKILLCDDNPAIPKSISSYLDQDGMISIVAENGTKALEIFRQQSPDLIVLDIMLPDMSGLDICREIRKTSDVPILMLSAKGDEIDRILGLEIGADDYVTKPFSPHEVYVRIKKLLRRNPAMPQEKRYEVAELLVLPDSFETFIGDKKIVLSAKEFEVLKYIACHVGKVRTREQIINAVWGEEYMAEPRVVDTLIKRLRHKLFDDLDQPVHFEISTVFGVGYKMEVMDEK